MEKREGDQVHEKRGETKGEKRKWREKRNGKKRKGGSVLASGMRKEGEMWSRLEQCNHRTNDRVE